MKIAAKCIALVTVRKGRKKRQERGRGGEKRKKKKQAYM
jgi:hypothetical protein